MEAVKWEARADFRRVSSRGYSVHVTPSPKATLNKNLADALDGRQIQFGMTESGLLVFRITVDGTGQFVRGRQTSSRVLKRLGIPPGTTVRVAFEEDDAVFVETFRLAGGMQP